MTIPVFEEKELEEKKGTERGSEVKNRFKADPQYIALRDESYFSAHKNTPVYVYSFINLRRSWHLVKRKMDVSIRLHYKRSGTPTYTGQWITIKVKWAGTYTSLWQNKVFAKLIKNIDAIVHYKADKDKFQKGVGAEDLSGMLNVWEDENELVLNFAMLKTLRLRRSTSKTGIMWDEMGQSEQFRQDIQTKDIAQKKLDIIT